MEFQCVVPPFWMLFEDEFSVVSMRDFGRGNERPLLPVEDKLGQWLDILLVDDFSRSVWGFNM